MLIDLVLEVRAVSATDRTSVETFVSDLVSSTTDYKQLTHLLKSKTLVVQTN